MDVDLFLDRAGCPDRWYAKIVCERNRGGGYYVEFRVIWRIVNEDSCTDRGHVDIYKHYLAAANRPIGMLLEQPVPLRGVWQELVELELDASERAAMLPPVEVTPESTTKVLYTRSGAILLPTTSGGEEGDLLAGSAMFPVNVPVDPLLLLDFVDYHWYTHTGFDDVDDFMFELVSRWFDL